MWNGSVKSLHLVSLWIRFPIMLSSNYLLGFLAQGERRRRHAVLRIDTVFCIKNTISMLCNRWNKDMGTAQPHHHPLPPWPCPLSPAFQRSSVGQRGTSPERAGELAPAMQELVAPPGCCSAEGAQNRLWKHPRGRWDSLALLQGSGLLSCFPEHPNLDHPQTRSDAS